MAVLNIEEYRQQNGDDILKVLLKPTKNFPDGYFYCDAIDEELVRSYTWCLLKKHPYIVAHSQGSHRRTLYFHQEKACNILDNYPDYINHVSDLKKFEKKDAMMILIASVDNHACRKILHEYFIHTESCYYLDAANEYSVGEVVVGVRIADTEISPDRIYYYPEILEDVSVPKSEESCQNINVSQPQHLVTNLFAANILLKCTIEIVSGDEWAGGIYYFDAFKQFLKFKEMPE